MTWCIHCGEDIQRDYTGAWTHVPFGSYRSSGTTCDSSHDGNHHPYKEES